ncbi:hypothetical protein MFIFM68171_06374 [Madurella fahalii]|uniref:Uncharacterized protein n=1 Tax=Madurella fahalii TaxID=1157608 RepID=A0ABQ0GEH5_9PEZI
MAAISHLSHILGRPDSRVSVARSDTTYHSFQDIELYEPDVPSQPSKAPVVCPPSACPSPKEEDRPAREMRRQDSGYESMTRRDSQSSGRRASATSLSSSTCQRRSKPSGQRAVRGRRPRNGRHSVSPPGSSRAHLQQSQQPVTYFHFPHFTSSDPTLNETERAMDPHNARDFASGPSYALTSETAAYPLPPQTTHYWTSDRTRRLEYAAIDAASKGVRGWVMRHVVPECFVPESKRRIGFEDDRGSVVRYRLELDAETSTEKAESVRSRGWKSWWFSMRRR